MRKILLVFCSVLLLARIPVYSQGEAPVPVAFTGIAYGTLSFYPLENADLYENTMSPGSINGIVKLFFSDKIAAKILISYEEVTPILRTVRQEEYYIHREVVLAGVEYKHAQKKDFSLYSSAQAGIIRERYNLIDKEGEDLNKLLDITLLGINWTKFKPLTGFLEVNYGNVGVIRAGMGFQW